MKQDYYAAILKEAATAGYRKGWEAGWDAACKALQAAASGFEMDSGSNLSLLAESAADHPHDSEVITSNMEQAAWQHEVAAMNAMHLAVARREGQK